MNRRAILTAIGLAPVAALPAVAAETPEERLEAARAEFLAAMDAAFAGKPDVQGHGAFFIGRVARHWVNRHPQ